MRTNNYETEIGYLSINHVGEELCGDNVSIISPDDSTKVVVLADGLGSGVKANILSTLTAELLSTMIANNIPIEDCVHSVLETLPVCKVRGVAYSTFTIVKVKDNAMMDIYNYDNPTPFMIREGKIHQIYYDKLLIEGKTIYHASMPVRLSDTVVLMSDGVKYAGVGETLNFGWDLPEIQSFMEALYQPSYSAKSMATVLIDHCNQLYNLRPGDDTTAVIVRIREREQVNLLIGPATNKIDDEKMLSLFFSKAGKHIVSGGKTSSIAAKYLHQELELALDYEDKEIPPTSRIKGVDLVTEGIITINKVLDYANNYLTTNSDYFSWSYKQDGASLIAKMLFEEATDINFFVGCAMNQAHQGEKINFQLKMQLIDELAKKLKAMGKNIKVSYF